jgi:hypothetical protein
MNDSLGPLQGNVSLKTLGTCVIAQPFALGKWVMVQDQVREEIQNILLWQRAVNQGHSVTVLAEKLFVNLSEINHHNIFSRGARYQQSPTWRHLSLL